MTTSPSMFTDPMAKPVKFAQRIPPAIFAFGESSFPVSFRFDKSPRTAEFAGATAIQLGTYMTDKSAFYDAAVIQLAIGESPSIELLATGDEASVANFYLKTAKTDGTAAVLAEYGLMEMRQPSFTAAVQYLFSTDATAKSLGPTVSHGDPYYPVARMSVLVHRILSSTRATMSTETAEDGSTAIVMAPASSWGLVDAEIAVVLDWYEDESRMIPASNPPSISVPTFGLRVYVSSDGKFSEGVAAAGEACTATSLYPTTVLRELGGHYAELVYWGRGADGKGLFWGNVEDVEVSSNGLVIQGGSETAYYLLGNPLADYDLSSSSSSSRSSMNSSSSSSSILNSSSSSSSSLTSLSTLSSRSSSSSSSKSSSSSSLSSVSSQSSISNDSSSSSSAVVNLSSSSSMLHGISMSSSSSMEASVVMLHKFSVAPNEFGAVMDDSGNGRNFTVAAMAGGLGPPQWDVGYGVDGGGFMFVADGTHTDYMQSGDVRWLAERGTISIWLKATSGNKIGIPFCVSNGFVTGKTEFAIQTDVMNGKVDVWLMVDGVTKWLANTNVGTFAGGSWTNIVITHDGSTPRAYINGVLSVLTYATSLDRTAWLATLSSATTPADKVVIGGAPRYYSPFMALGFSGQMDELTVWENALSASSVLNAFEKVDSLSSQSFSSQSSSSSSQSSNV